MKKTVHLILVLLLLFSFKMEAQESKSALNLGSDFVSSYVWRGTKFGNGPAIQPKFEFASGKFTLGAWGSFCISDEQAMESDLYTSYTLGPVTLGMTGYYFPGVSFFKSSNHAFELNGGLNLGKISLSANYILNEGAGAAGGDVYLEAGAALGPVNLFAGAGNGWYTSNHNFNVCNLGLSSTKEIKITDSFSIPLKGSVILNPSTEQFYVVVGISL